jgi:hypothetical protein
MFDPLILRQRVLGLRCDAINYAILHGATNIGSVRLPIV